MLGSVGQLGRVGVTAIAESAQGADSVYQSVEAALDRAGRRRLVSPPSRGRAAA